MTKFVNLTPHAINFTSGLTVPPSGTVARVACVQEKIGMIDGIPVFQTVYGEIESLPNPQENTVYIVSSLVASRTSRTDVLVPCNFIRDEKGHIVAAGGLQRI